MHQAAGIRGLDICAEISKKLVYKPVSYGLLRPTEARPGGVPEENKTLVRDIGDSDEVPLLPVSGVEGLLYLFHEACPALDREFMGEEAPVASFFHLLSHLFSLGSVLISTSIGQT